MAHHVKMDKAAKYENRNVLCPHCDAYNGDYDNFRAGESYECESCSRIFAITDNFLEDCRGVEEFENTTKLEALEKRIKRLEKELGIK